MIRGTEIDFRAGHREVRFPLGESDITRFAVRFRDSPVPEQLRIRSLRSIPVSRADGYSPRLQKCHAPGSRAEAPRPASANIAAAGSCLAESRKSISRTPSTIAEPILRTRLSTHASRAWNLQETSPQAGLPPRPETPPGNTPHRTARHLCRGYRQTGEREEQKSPIRPKRMATWHADTRNSLRYGTAHFTPGRGHPSSVSRNS